MYYALTYQLCENYMDKRTAHRGPHFEHLTSYKSKGHFLMGGAFDDQESALLIFTVDDPDVIEEFAKTDPYVINGVVTKWSYRKWNMVTGDVVAVDESK